MARKNTIKLLLINASDNEAERLVSLFRSHGRVVRPQRAASAEDLRSALELAQQKPGAWDLLIVDDHHPEISVEACLEQLRKLRADLPALVLRANADLPALFAAGARDVVDPTDEQRLLGAALREAGYTELRRGLADLQRQLREAEQRNALLLGEAEQAIAYVADGMVINANPLFAERFGHTDPDELDCAPVIDLIDPTSHDQFKALLKSGDDTEFTFTGLTADGGSFQASMALCSASYDGEPCTQLTIREPSAAGNGPAGDFDDDSRLFSRAYLTNQLSGANSGSLLLLAIDGFAQHRVQLGFSRARRLAAELAEHLAGQLVADGPTGAVLARAADDSLALLAADIDTEAAQELAERLCRSVEAHIVELDGQSLQCTLSIGIALVEAVPPAELLDRADAACQKARDNGGNGAAVHTAERTRRGLRSDGETALEEALEDERFSLLFQPIISLRGTSGDHYETLLRLRGDTDAQELPDNFLETLGVNAAHAKLDRWLLLEATKRLADNRAGGNDTRLVINLTANALQDEALAAWLGVALKAAGLPAHALVLQFREIDLINYLKPARLFADTVRQLGCRLSVAGFGRALDPLKTLKHLTVDLVQVDGVFTRELQTSGDAQPLKDLVAAANGLDVKVIIPFVENASVLATLWQVGADFIQGHYLQAPGREMNYEFTDIA